MWGAFGSQRSGGYVCSAPGWEFVPMPRGDSNKHRGRSRSPRAQKSSTPEEARLNQAATSDQSPGGKYELQWQHWRLRKRFEDLKKRHVQEKEEWTVQKETLLREVAEIQSGENKRILLELKSSLKEVQAELRKEEIRRCDLQAQYTKDRCAWELERAELKCRIAQLETKRSNCYINKTALEPKGTFKREREEQKRLLADTHTAAMDLRKQLENNERGWLREKGELLERFDLERKEWEGQLKDMQRKIEELYNEVKARRENGVNGQEYNTGNEGLRLSSHSSSSDSSSLNEINDQENQGNNEADMTEMEHILHKHETKHISSSSPNEPAWMDYLNPGRSMDNDFPNSNTTGNDKKKYTSALNAALKEIAKVSAELCSYQDEVRKKSIPKRNRTLSSTTVEESEKLQNEKNKADINFALNFERLKLSPEMSEDSNTLNWAFVDSHINEAYRTKDDKAEMSVLNKKEAPPVPPRTTSWHLSSSPVSQAISSPVTEVKSESVTSVSDKKCNSPLVLKKFGALLQENEGKMLTDSGFFTNTMPVYSNCTTNCCQSRWSCDASKLGNKSSVHTSVQKSYSDFDILSFESECILDKPSKNPNHPDSHYNSAKMEFAKDSSSPCSPIKNGEFTIDSSSSFHGNYRAQNEDTLKVINAQFNKSLFHDEKGSRAMYNNSLLEETKAAGTPFDAIHNNGLSCTVMCHENGKRWPKSKGSVLLESILNGKAKNAKLNVQDMRNGFTSQNAKTKDKQISGEHWNINSLASCPRSADSRSNYGAYEYSAGDCLTSNCDYFHVQQKSRFAFTHNQSENLSELLDMLENEQNQRLSAGCFSQAHLYNGNQLSSKETSPASSASLVKRNFPRPAQPANKRLPSRWATKSTSTPQTPSKSSHKQTYSCSYFSETAII
ncbi:uncharacterized protein KIAA0408-like isoform X1 [Polypterus senegalus]|uniref:uncharacterized protein KIAA0408-like isoform X1 n=1 Tax=Polypterus senegalus TaxID=55291 RepID=UPI001966AB30|nr:uncharacterized protein KIAA0408-like isoform X1 [Polypterus senegalus]